LWRVIFSALKNKQIILFLFVKMSKAARITRSSGKDFYTCYDYYVCNSLKENAMCHKCRNYFNDPNKKKQQHERGVRFACEKPQKVGVQLTSNSRPRSPRKRKHAAVSSNESPLVGTTDSTPKRKKTKHQLLVQQLNGTVRNHAVQLEVMKAEKERADAELVKVNERLLGSMACNVTIQNKYNDLLTCSQEEIHQLTEKIALLEIKTRLLNKKLSKVKKNSKKKDYQIRCFQARSKDNIDPGETAAAPFKSCSVLVKKLVEKKAPPKIVVTGIMEALMAKKRFHCHIRNYVTSDEFCQSIPSIAEVLQKSVYNGIKEKFKPWVCLRELDLSGTVSLSGFDVIRKIEFSDLESSRYKRGILCSRSVLSRLARKLEKHAATVIPYTIDESSVKFDVSAALTFLLKKYKLWNRVRAAAPDGKVLIAATCDGGSLAWNLSHVSAGIKLVDPKTVDPRTGQFMFGASGYEKVQSRATCIPLMVHIAKDTKAFYDVHVRSFFDDVNRFEEAHHTGLRVAAPADMCSLVRTIGRGGAMKNCRYACYCCSVHRDNIAKPNDTLCEFCIAQGSNECYHHEITDENVIQRLEAEAQEMVSTYPHLLRFPFTDSRIRFGLRGVNVDNSRDPKHVEFSPRNHTERIRFKEFLRDELKLRIPDMDDDQIALDVLRLNLTEFVLLEERYRLIVEVLEANTLEEAMVRFEKAVPCLLHVENRISECLIFHLLLKGWHLREDSNEAMQEYTAEVQICVNENLFGTPRCPSNWKSPLKPDGTMDAIKLANWRARRFIEEIELFIDICIPAEHAEERRKWKECIRLYSETIKVRIRS